MTRFNAKTKKTVPPRPLQTAATPSGLTGNAAPGFARDAKGELFLLAVSNFVGQDTFYEKAGTRDDRFLKLIYQVVAEDPDWMMRFLPWLRSEANMRTAAIIAAVESADVMAARKIPGGRQLVAAVLQRADEPGEALAYAKNVIGKVAKPVKRGIADAAARMYNERNTLKYDTASHGFRFGDVLELCHVRPNKMYQHSLFPYLLERRHNRETAPSGMLSMINGNADLRAELANGPMTITPELLQNTGMTWEDILSLVGSKMDKGKLWTQLIPTMGYMALLRNLRNFDEAGVSDEVAGHVIAKLANPDEVARSRQLPMRFLSAYRNAPSLRWGYALERGLHYSLNNVPVLPGRTLILVDTSGSMHMAFGKDSSLMRWDAAVIFGLALAQRAEHADVFSFSNASMRFPLTPGESLLRSIDRWKGGGFFQGGGTATESAVRSNYANHDRVLILTDEQANYHHYGDVTSAVPANRMVITFNLAGYKLGHAAGSPTRVTIGGLSDSAFKLIPMLEHVAAGSWPF